jgi:hypothetical protein
MLESLIVTALLLAQSDAEVQPRQPAPDIRVVIATPVYQPDGAVAIETTTIASGAPGVVHVFGRRTLCDTATAGADEPAGAGFGWRLTSHIVSATPTAIVVSVDWQRVWDRGQKIAGGPAGTVQLTLHPGDRIPLDLISNAKPTDACRAVAMALEVSASRTVGPASPASSLLPLGAVAGGVGLVDAEMWLVHTLPAGTVQAQHQRVRVPADAASFAFAPVSLRTAGGDASVAFTGSLKRYRSPSGGEFLYLSMTRRVTGGPGMSASGVSGVTGTVISLPGPAEVLSLEIPAAQQQAAGFGGGGARGAGRGAGRSPGPAIGEPPRRMPPGSGVAAGGQAGTARGGGGGAVISSRGGAAAVGNPAAQVVSLLEGHGFSLRLRVTPVPGS